MFSYRLCESSVVFWPNAACAYFLWCCTQRGLWAAKKRSSIETELPPRGDAAVHLLQCIVQNIPSGLCQKTLAKSEMRVCQEARVSAYYSHCRPSSPCFAWMIWEYGCVRPHVGAITAKREKKAPTGRTVSSVIRMCAGEKTEGRRKGSLLTRGGRKVGPLGIIRWEFKGGPTFAM